MKTPSYSVSYLCVTGKVQILQGRTFPESHASLPHAVAGHYNKAALAREALTILSVAAACTVLYLASVLCPLADFRLRLAYDQQGQREYDS